jgi:cytochrome c553
VKNLSLLRILCTSQAALAAGNAANGAAKAAVCGACHGPTGISVNPLWPNLAGQQELYMAKQIKAFRDGTRQEPTMQPFVMSLSDQDADDLAAHFSGLKTCP